MSGIEKSAKSLGLIHRDALVEKAKALTWYHNFHLPNGGLIKGWRTANATIVREAFRRIDLSGRRCVDLGAMDGLYAVLMKQMGAADVFAFDRKDRIDQISIIKEFSGKDFRYVPEVSMRDVRFHLRRRWNGELADFVNFSGILYHMFDIMSGIGYVRGMVRRGGLVLLDTPAIVSPDPIMYYNWNDKFYGPGTYIVPSVFCLEKMCNFLGFQIIDAFYSNQSKLLGLSQVRIALMLRAGDFPVFSEKSDKLKWTADYVLDDLLETMDMQQIRSIEDAAVQYASAPTGFCQVPTEGTGGRLFRFCKEYPELPFNEPDMFLSL